MTAKLQKVEWTIQRHGKYHAKLRVPHAIRQHYQGKEFFQKSLKTSDPKTAEREVRALKAIMDAQVEASKADQGVKALARNLPADQRALLDRAGGLDGLTKQFDAGKVRLAFMHGSGVERTPEFDWEEGPNGAPQKVYLGPSDVDEEEIAVERASHAAATDVVRAQANARGRVLRQLGQDVQLIGDVFSLRDVWEKWSPSVDKQTADAVAYYVRRFNELHGEVALTELSLAHLREFIDAISFGVKWKIKIFGIDKKILRGPQPLCGRV